MIHKRFGIALAAAALTTLACAPTNSESDFGHFDPKGKPPSEHTLKVFEEARQTLPFSDRQDYKERDRGFIARREDLKIMADDPDLAITINRSDLEQVMMGAKSFMAQIEDGTARTEGNLGVLEQLGSTMIDFDLFFEILPGTKGPSAAADLNDFEVGPIGEGHE